MIGERVHISTDMKRGSEELVRVELAVFVTGCRKQLASESIVTMLTLHVMWKRFQDSVASSRESHAFLP